MTMRIIYGRVWAFLENLVFFKTCSSDDEITFYLNLLLIFMKEQSKLIRENGHARSSVRIFFSRVGEGEEGIVRQACQLPAFQRLHHQV